jgi:mono/diheme cytochrome c family protein
VAAFYSHFSATDSDRIAVLAFMSAEPNQLCADGDRYHGHDLDQSVWPLPCEFAEMRYPLKLAIAAMAAGAICIFGSQSFSHAMHADAQRPDNRASARISRKVAKQYCAGCHAIGRTGVSPNPKALRFPLITERYPGNNPAKMVSISYELIVDTDESDQWLDVLHRNVRKYGTVSNTIAAATKLEGTIRRKS